MCSDHLMRRVGSLEKTLMLGGTGARRRRGRQRMRWLDGITDLMDVSLRELLEPAQIHVHQVGDAIQPSHPLSSPSLPTFNLSQHQGLFKWVSSSHLVAKVLEFIFNISPSNEYLGLISFRIDWLDLLEVQGTLKSLLQHHSPKASILQHSAFFIV